MSRRIRLGEHDLVTVQIAHDEHVHPSGLYNLSRFSASPFDSGALFPHVTDTEVESLMSHPASLFLGLRIVQAELRTARGHLGVVWLAIQIGVSQESKPEDISKERGAPLDVRNVQHRLDLSRELAGFFTVGGGPCTGAAQERKNRRRRYTQRFQWSHRFLQLTAHMTAGVRAA
ncbi:MAG: hypothetical protein P8099_17445 [Gemmatimonadota bacterium]